MAFYSDWAWNGETSKVSTALLVLALGTLIWFIRTPTSDPREPPVLSPRVPYIGHLLGLAIDQAEYLQKLRFDKFTRSVSRANPYL